MTRSLMLSAVAVLVLHACDAQPRGDAATSADTFTSDRITVVTRGEGPDIILVPGLASHRDVWAGVADSLDDRYRLHLVQVKGFAGLEPASNASGPVSAPVAEEIARYIAEAELERPAVIGHSMGGTIGMMLGARHPDRVGRLMVVDMFPSMGAIFSPGSTPDQLRAAADTFSMRILADTAGAPNGMLEQMFAGMTRVDSLKPMLMEGLRGTDRQVAANAFHELIITDLTPELSRITVPVTVLYAPPPEVQMPPEQFDQMMRQAFSGMPQARLVRVDGSKHFIMFDEPQRFIAEVDTLMRAGQNAAGGS